MNPQAKNTVIAVHVEFTLFQSNRRLFASLFAVD